MSKRYNTTGLATLVEFGKGASQIKSSGSDLQVRNNADTAFANMSGLDATATTHFVTLSQLNAVSAGISFKESVRVCSTVSVTVASPGASIDGIAMSVGDRVALTAQGTASENGLWVWNGAAVAMTRPTDWATGTNQSGSAFIIREGTCADNMYVASADPAVVDTDDPLLLLIATVAAGVSSVNDAVAVPAGGSSFLDTAGTGAVTMNVLDDSDRISVSLASSIITLDIKAGSIDTAQLADDGVTEAKVAPLAGIHFRRVSVASTDAGSSVNIGAVLPANAVVQEVKVNTTTAFDVAVTLEIGIAADPDLLQDSTVNDLANVDLYITDHDESGAAGLQLLATLGSGSPTVGAATITVAFIVTA